MDIQLPSSMASHECVTDYQSLDTYRSVSNVVTAYLQAVHSIIAVIPKIKMNNPNVLRFGNKNMPCN